MMADECCGSDDLDASRPDDDTEFNAAIEELARDERRILAALGTPEATAEFLRDPGNFLRRLRIQVPAAVAHRLRLPRANRADTLIAQPIVLPNGQTITPKITVRITGRRR
jgi:hypothetical protein